MRRGDGGCVGGLGVEDEGAVGRSVRSLGLVWPACLLRRATNFSAISVGCGAWRSLPFLEATAGSGVGESGIVRGGEGVEHRRWWG